MRQEARRQNLAIQEGRGDWCAKLGPAPRDEAKMVEEKAKSDKTEAKSETKEPKKD